MDEFFGKKYALVETENFGDYLAYLGFNYVNRKLALTLKQTVRLSYNEDGRYKFEIFTPFSNSKVVFTPGVEIDEIRSDGAKLKSVILMNNNRLIHKQTDEAGNTSVHVREFHSDRMITTTSANGLDKIVLRKYELQC